MQVRHIALIALAAASFQAQADIVALWDYNQTPTSTKHTQSANGASFATVGGVTTTFAAGVTGQALNTTGYGTASTPSGTRGVQFNVDTSGYTDIVLTFAQRDSSTASAWTQLQYTVDGDNWLSAMNFLMPNGGSNPAFISAGKTYDFSSINAVEDNPLFGVRFVSIHAPGTTGYVAANASSGAVFANSGTIRYDNVLFSGTAIPAVPEPQTYALMLAGLIGIGLIARRRAR